ncbi:MAG: T9SS type A sorting domain-containing protein [Flavobacteriales bacterium]|nr:T9SS type A sorting domain-containing protein [Flavobacteriales bacterium]
MLRLKKNTRGIIGLSFALCLGGIHSCSLNEKDFPTDEVVKATSSAEEETKNPAPNDHWRQMRSYPNGFNKEEFLLRMDEVQEHASLSAVSRDVILSNSWQQEGPNNIGGRFNVLEAHPTDPDIFYAGAANGGIFKTTDGGSTYTPIFDDHAYLAIGEIKLDPTDPEKIWVGTGDRNFGGGSHIGNGVYLSEDEGDSWTHMGLEEMGIVTEIHIDPTDPDRIFVGTLGNTYEKTNDRGVYRSTDGGMSWENVLFVSDSSGVCDMVMDPTNPDILYAGFFNRINLPFQAKVSGPDSHIFKTTDGGDNWTELGGGLPTNESRVGIEIAPSNPNTLYALFVDNITLNPTDVYKTTDGGMSWTALNVYASGLDPEIMGGFGWYFGQIHLNPYDEDQLVIQGVEQWYSPDGGLSWFQNVPEWDTYEVHADKHDILFTSATGQIIATDGGIYKTDDLGFIWEDIDDIPVTQFYHIDVDPLNDGIYGGGAQDNGSMQGNGLDPDNWIRLFGGDGFRQTWMELDEGGRYYETQNGGLYYDGPSSGLLWISPPVFDPDRVNWDMPYAVNEFTQELFVGTSQIKIMQFAPWSGYEEISGDLTKVAWGVFEGNESQHTVSEIELSYWDEGMIFAGTTDGLAWRGEGAGTDWSWSGISAGLPNRYCTAIKSSPNNEGVVFIAFSGYELNDTESYLYKSEDNGESWTDISSNLPSITVNDVLVVPGHDDDYIFAALDGGVYFSENGGESWDYVGTDLPMATISELHLDVPNEKLIAGTYSRSMWSYDISWIDNLEEPPSIGIEESEEQAFVCYPNPVKDLLYFQNVVVDEIEIYGLNGQLLGSKKVIDAGNVKYINLQSLPKGTYVIKAGTKQKKIIRG